jgi:hypothetical protein
LRVPRTSAGVTTVESVERISSDQSRQFAAGLWLDVQPRNVAASWILYRGDNRAPASVDYSIPHVRHSMPASLQNVSLHRIRVPPSRPHTT